MSAWIAYVNFLEHFVNLKALHIEYSAWFHWPTNAIPLLRLLPAPGKLRKLVFQTLIAEREVTREEWLRDLDAELERKDFHNLMEVVFNFTISRHVTSEEQIVELIEGNLPKLSSRSPLILRIDVTIQ